MKFAPDLGVSIKDGTNTYPDLRSITITSYAMAGNGIRVNKNCIEISHEVGEYLGTFFIPISIEEFKHQMKTNGCVSFEMVDVGETEHLENGDTFAVIECRLVS